ncbi:MAG: transposase [Candidatus Kapaibacterium sp.]|nr:MAG: transposase [Candidatus Kapabacteria bacterium]
MLYVLCYQRRTAQHSAAPLILFFLNEARKEPLVLQRGVQELLPLKGIGERAFYQWLERDYRHLFPRLPERTRLFRALERYCWRCADFMAPPTTFGVVDSYGIELIHPMCEGRSVQQIGRKGISNHRWIVGGKLAVVLNKFGLVCDWDVETANTPDNIFQDSLIKQYEEIMIVMTDTHFWKKADNCSNIKPRKRGTWNVRMVVETVCSLVDNVCSLKKVAHRSWNRLVMRLAYTMAAFNICMLWQGHRT